MILVVDVGTSSIRGILLDLYGKPVWKVQRGYELHTPLNGVVELNMSVLNQYMNDILIQMGKWLHEQSETVDCISVTAQRSSVIPVNADGIAIANAMMWQDTRSGYLCDMLKDKKEQIYRISGMRPSPVFSAPKMQYLKNHNRDVYNRAYKLIGFQEYVICYLTGEFVTDYSIASRTCLFHIEKQEWSDELIGLFDIDKSKLCHLIPPGSLAGETKKEIGAMLCQSHKIPVISAGGDQQCAALGLGCINQGETVVNSGTGSYVMFMSEKPVYDSQMRVNCNLSAIPDRWILEGAVLSAGKTINWLNNLMFFKEGDVDAFDRFTEACKSSSPGAKGMVFLPTLSGKGTPVWNPDMRGVIGGLNLEHSKADFGRALLEGIASEMRQCIDVMEDLTGVRCTKVKTAGGMTRNDLYNQIQADIYQRTVVKPSENEATGIGAWISAAVYLGCYRNHSAAYNAAVDEVKLTEYRPDLNMADVYGALYIKLRQYEGALKKQL